MSHGEGPRNSPQQRDSQVRPMHAQRLVHRSMHSVGADLMQAWMQAQMPGRQVWVLQLQLMLAQSLGMPQGSS